MFQEQEYQNKIEYKLPASEILKDPNRLSQPRCTKVKNFFKIKSKPPSKEGSLKKGNQGEHLLLEAALFESSKKVEIDQKLKTTWTQL